MACILVVGKSPYEAYFLYCRIPCWGKFASRRNGGGSSDTWSRKREGRNVRPLSLVVSVSRKTPVAKSITSRTRGGVVALENHKEVEAQVYCFEKKKQERKKLFCFISERNIIYGIFFFDSIKNTWQWDISFPRVTQSSEIFNPFDNFLLCLKTDHLKEYHRLVLKILPRFFSGKNYISF